jgi:GT2 family glycosyltransferase
MHDLAIIIVNWNGGTVLLQALDALHRALEGRKAQVLLVDNASTDSSADDVHHQFSQIALIRNATNLGFGAANNKGFAQAHGRYVLVLNPDVQINRAALGTLVQFMESHPRSGACGPGILEANGRTASPWCARRDPHPLDVFFEYAYLYRLFPHQRFLARYVMGDWDHASDRQVDALSGACMLVRREVIERVGGFDEGFFMYGEDLDWCRRIRQGGWQVWFVPGATVLHTGAHSTRQIGDHGARWAVASHLRYFRKWGRPGDLVKVRVALSVGCLSRALAWLLAAVLHPRQWRYALSRSAGYCQYSWLAWKA